MASDVVCGDGFGELQGRLVTEGVELSEARYAPASDGGSSVVEARTVRRRLETIEHRLSRLEKPAGTPFEVDESDTDRQDIVEPNL